MFKKISLTILIAFFISSQGLIYDFPALAQEDSVDNAEEVADITKTDVVDDDESYFTRAEWGADEGLLLDRVVKRSEPEKLVLVELMPVTKIKSSQDFIKELYYFFTYKMGLGDLPFHYIIDTDGNVYEGNSKGNDTLLPVEGYTSGELIVGYINNPNEELVTQETIDENYKSATHKILDKSWIKPSSIMAKDINLKLDLENKESALRFGPLEDGDFLGYVSNMKDAVVSGYTAPNREYSLELLNVAYGKDAKPGSETEVEVELKNSGKNSIYYDGASEVSISTDKEIGRDSKLYINQVWDTKSVTPIMNEQNDVFSIEETKKFKFKIKLPLEVGKLTESFVVIDKFGEKFEGTEFDLEFDLDLGDLQVLEIKNTETGFLRVREEGFYSAAEKTQVLPGERFIYEERNDVGWYKIKLGENNYGWITQQYATIIQ